VSNISVFPSFFFGFCALGRSFLAVRCRGTAVRIVLSAASLSSVFSLSAPRSLVVFTSALDGTPTLTVQA
jgi:hypothetical protein